MAWPPTIPPNNRTNDTLLTDAHPSDHNVTANALTDLVARVNANAVGTWRRMTSVALTTNPGQSGIGTTVTDLTGLGVGFTADGTKRYRVTFTLTMQVSAAGWMQVYLCKADNTVLQDAVHSQAAGGYAAFNYTYEAAPGVLVGAVTLKLRANVQAGTGSINQGPTAPSLVLVDECV